MPEWLGGLSNILIVPSSTLQSLGSRKVVVVRQEWRGIVAAKAVRSTTLLWDNHFMSRSGATNCRIGRKLTHSRSIYDCLCAQTPPFLSLDSPQSRISAVLTTTDIHFFTYNTETTPQFRQSQAVHYLRRTRFILRSSAQHS